MKWLVSASFALPDGEDVSVTGLLVEAESVRGALSEVARQLGANADACIECVVVLDSKPSETFLAAAGSGGVEY